MFANTCHHLGCVLSNQDGSFFFIQEAICVLEIIGITQQKGVRSWNLGDTAKINGGLLI
jgi:hypothetical protein